MADSSFIQNDFLLKITGIIEENISNEQFGVSELAAEAGMSRSNLLRKIKKMTGLSASRFISRMRLEHALEMLKDESYTVSEVSYKVGFGSTSYFIRCFKEQYGYPPGEASNKSKEEIIDKAKTQSVRNKVKPVVWSLFVVVVAILLVIFTDPFSFRQQQVEKSIAVLPFINDSHDSSNIYIVNGLMESLLNKLQRIEDLRVISRTSVEKYRGRELIIPEIARELDVNYFIEGSGQKIGDRIMLNIQLIEGPTDKHLWAAQYNRRAVDIFDLQNEVARDITEQIQAVITPDEQVLIEKAPTHNLEAYDYFLKGLDHLFMRTEENSFQAIRLFEKAIELDSTFARAYADLAIAYFSLDMYHTVKKYSHLINHNADRALLYDPQLAQALMAKAMFYFNTNESDLAIPYLEKALEYNPNSAYVITMLADYYTTREPDTKKYLKYALKGARLDISTHDSATASFTFLHIGNAFIQSGFVDEADRYISKSISYNPNNLFSAYVKAYILFARDRDLQKMNESLLETLSRDSSRLDVMQEVGKSFYYLRDYGNAFKYYDAFCTVREKAGLSIYVHENAKIGLVYERMGHHEMAENYLQQYKIYADNDVSIYKHLSLAVYHSYYNENDKAIYHLKEFSKEKNFHYWTLLFLKIDPLVDNIKDLPEFKTILNEIERKFWNSHDSVYTYLEAEDLI